MSLTPKKASALGISFIILSFFAFFLLDFNPHQFFKNPLVFESDQSFIELLITIGVLLILYAEILKFNDNK